MRKRVKQESCHIGVIPLSMFEGAPSVVLGHDRVSGLCVQALGRIATVILYHSGLFLPTWMLSLSGSPAFFALYPILVREVFGIPPLLSSLTFALAVSLRLVLYAPAGR
jgi:hypothetical protein